MATPDLVEGLRHVTLRDLEVFREACTRGSLRAAGRVFRLEAPHVSKILARLEARVGVKVLERSAKGVAPTLAGQELLEVVRRLEDSLSGRTTTPGTRGSEKRGILSCGAVSFLSVHVWSRAAARLDPAFPYRLRITELGSGSLMELGLRGQVDLALHTSTLTWTKSWVSKAVGELRWGLYGRTLHPLTGTTTSARVREFPFVIPVYLGGDGIQLGEDYCPLNVSHRRHGTEVSTAAIGMQIAASTDELIFAPHLVAKPMIDSGRLLEILVTDWKPVRERLWLSAHRDRVPQKVLGRLVELTRDELSR